jgi:hypothetical protein
MDLATRLGERRTEIEGAMLARVYAVSDPSEVEDPEYAIGLKDAVSAAIDYAIVVIEAAGRESAPVPEQLRHQARAAARNGVPLDTVLRRYSAGYTLLGDFIVGEAEAGGFAPGAKLQDVLRIVAGIFDRLVASISQEYASEAEGYPQTAGRRRTKQVRMLLAGEPVDTGELRYRLDAWHLAVIASGPGAVEALRDLCAGLDGNLLLVCPDEEAIWAWLGGRNRLSARETLRLAKRALPAEVCLAIGEPGRGIEGWRLTHRQAKAAIAVAQRGLERQVRYVDVALLASALRDDVLARSLREIYLAPLEAGRDDGAVLRGTLTAYFHAGQNASSAAAALGVSRKTVGIRLRSVGERVGRPVDRCAAELETALRLRDLAHDRGGP